MATVDSSPSPIHASTRTLAAAGIIGPVLFLAVLGLLDILNGRLDLSGNELGRFGVLMHLDFLVFGLLLLAFALGLRRHLRPGKASFTATALLLLFALGPLLATFTLDPGNGPPSTWHGTLHFFGFLLITLALVPALVVFAWVFRGDPRWRGYSWISLTVAVVMAVDVFAPNTPSGSSYPIWSGPASMLELALIGAWLVTTASRLWTLAGMNRTSAGHNRSEAATA
jgi:hypothetical protein